MNSQMEESPEPRARYGEGRGPSTPSPSPTTLQAPPCVQQPGSGLNRLLLGLGGVGLHHLGMIHRELSLQISPLPGVGMGWKAPGL